MNRFILFLTLVSISLYSACQPSSWTKITAVPSEIPSTDYVVPEGLPSTNSWESYIVDSMHLDHLPVKRVRVNFHFMNSTDSSQNYNLEKAKSYSWLLVKGANKKLDNNQPSHLPLHNDIPVLHPRIQYVQSKSTGYPLSTFVHYDDDLYYFIKKNNKNVGSREVINKYGVGRDSIINVFMMPHHPDSLKSKTYSGGLTGVALGFATKIATSSITEVDAWRNTSNFNHELGHIFGLPHSWGSDGCDDTFRHNNKCWNFTNNGSVCDSMVANNLMSYNIQQNSITPCQIGKMQAKMTKYKSKLRNYIIKDWCNYDAKNPIIISEEIYWTGEKDLPNDIVIKAGASLYISSRLAMAPGSKIMVEAGGRLILDGARIHNDCGKSWNGIWQAHPEKSEIIYLNNPVLEDVNVPTSSELD